MNHEQNSYQNDEREVKNIYIVNLLISLAKAGYELTCSY